MIFEERRVDMVDIEKFESLVRKYQKSLFQYCYYRLKENKPLTEETFNDILTVLFQKWDTLDLDSNIRAWLYRVADNCIKHNLEKYNSFYDHNDSLDSHIERSLVHEMVFDEYFSDPNIDEEEYIYIIRDKLPQEYQAIFTYRYIEKKTITETAELVGIPYSSLRLRLKKMDVIIRAEIKKLLN